MNVLKAKRRLRRKSSEGAKEAPKTIIDFDAPEPDSSKFDNNLEFPLEEDMINLGVWIQLNHPHFFDGSCKGHLRFAFWLLNTFFIIGIQVLCVMKFNVQSLQDIMGPYEQWMIMKKQGKARTYDNWMQSVRNASLLEKNATIDDLADLNSASSLYNDYSDPYLTYVSLGVLSMICISIIY